MMNWRKIDSWLFSPPHTFPTILALVATRLSLDFDFENKRAELAEIAVAEPEKNLGAYKPRTTE